MSGNVEVWRDMFVSVDTNMSLEEICKVLLATKTVILNKDKRINQRVDFHPKENKKSVKSKLPKSKYLISNVRQTG